MKATSAEDRPHLEQALAAHAAAHLSLTSAAAEAAATAAETPVTAEAA